MKKFFEDFKDFALRGNVMDMAIGVIIGGAFGKIITSIVGDIIMPPLDYLISNANAGSMKWILREGVKEKVNDAGDVIVPAVEEIAVNYGAFIQNCIDFVFIAFVIFLMIKLVTKLKNLRKKKEETPDTLAEPSKEEVLLTEIRDLLKEKKY